MRFPLCHGTIRKTIVPYSRFTSHTATKTWGSRELFHSDLFSSLSNDSK